MTTTMEEKEYFVRDGMPADPETACPEGRMHCIGCGAPKCEVPKIEPEDRPTTGPADLMTFGL